MEYYDDENRLGGYQTEREPRNANRTNGMALASMFCGITAILLLCFCILFPVSILLGVAAIVLAILSKMGEPFSGYAIAGLILGIIAVLLGIAAFVYLMIINAMLRDPQWAPFFDEVMKQYEEIMNSR